MRTKVRRLIGLAGSVAVAALVLAACGSSDDSGGGSDEKASTSDVAKYQQQLDALYKGTYEAPSGGPVEPPKGKNVWIISTGQEIETAQNASAAMEEAGQTLGWEVTLFDGKFESSRQISGIEQALADKADGIVLLYVDCDPVKSGIQQAKKAGVAVVGIESKDCEPGLENHVVKYAGDEDFAAWVAHGFGGTQAKWVIAKTKGEAKTIVTVQTDLYTTAVTYDPGITDEFENCKTCEIVDTIEFVGTEFGPPLQQKIEQSLNKHPEANSFIAAYDAVLTGGGGAAALRASGRLDEIESMGGEGSVPGIELIYDNAGMDACSGIPTAWEGYGAIMGLARVFAGQDPDKGNSGIGAQACDKDHNLPPEGESYQAPIDYVAEYNKLWGVE
ncbi:MAG TPA: substrate-binding domain-containing protein [Solirubrobacterales bacterium]|nr:substrate-binding domain-containing protein [Solirubrobacterales bacterium]